MAILGIGVDIVKVERVKLAMEKHGEAFLKRIFTPVERAYCEAHPKRKFEHYAGRFAAKEAFYKAAHPAKAGIKFNQIGVINQENGAPSIDLPDAEHARLGIPGGAQFFLSMAHENEFVVATVVISHE